MIDFVLVSTSTRYGLVRTIILLPAVHDDAAVAGKSNIIDLVLVVHRTHSGYYWYGTCCWYGTGTIIIP